MRQKKKEENNNNKKNARGLRSPHKLNTKTYNTEKWRQKHSFSNRNEESGTNTRQSMYTHLKQYVEKKTLSISQNTYKSEENRNMTRHRGIHMKNHKISKQKRQC